MEKPGGLSKAEREMIVVATSGLNNCHYCVVAHGAILRIRAKNPLIADQVAINYRKADLTPRQKAMLDFALKVAERSHEIDEADYEALSATVSPTTTPGTSPRSPPSSPCPTGSRTPSPSGRTMNSMRWGGRVGVEAHPRGDYGEEPRLIARIAAAGGSASKRGAHAPRLHIAL